MARTGTIKEIYPPRLKAMERQCVYRMGDGCPCENQIDCRIPDALLVAEIGMWMLDYQNRFEALRKRWAEQNGHEYQPMRFANTGDGMNQ